MPKGKKKPVERDKGLRQVPIRLHQNDYRALKKLFIDERWNMKRFVSACVELYLTRDPLMLKAISDWQDENAAPKEIKGYSHSPREANRLFREIAGEED